MRVTDQCGHLLSLSKFTRIELSEHAMEFTVCALAEGASREDTGAVLAIFPIDGRNREQVRAEASKIHQLIVLSLVMGRKKIDLSGWMRGEPALEEVRATITSGGRRDCGQS